MGKKPPLTNGAAEKFMAATIDDLDDFERFRQEVLPMLRKAVVEGWPADRIYKMAQSHAAAKAVTFALTERDSARALTAIKEVLDRGGGKAVERKEIKSVVADMTDEELQRLIASEVEDLDE